MTSSSRSTASRSAFAWILVGLAALGAGCSRLPAPPRPARVYVNEKALARYHPDWPAVTALDQQIAWLEGYAPRPVTVPSMPGIATAIPAADQVRVDIAALRQRIQTTLAAVREREIAAQQKRLARARARIQAVNLRGPRLQLEDEANTRLQAVFDKWDVVLANLDVQQSLVSTLERTYTARAAAQAGQPHAPDRPSWEDLAKEMGQKRTALAAEAEQARTARTAGVNEVFAWLESQLKDMLKAGAAEALASLKANREDMETLDANIEHQRAILMDALNEVALPLPATPGPKPSAAPAAMGAVVVPPLPSPDLQARIATLKARRSELVDHILRNTRAIVTAAAKRRTEPMEPVFRQTTKPLPDETNSFRSVVSDPVSGIESLTPPSGA